MTAREQNGSVAAERGERKTIPLITIEASIFEIFTFPNFVFEWLYEMDDRAKSRRLITMAYHVVHLKRCKTDIVEVDERGFRCATAER